MTLPTTMLKLLTGPGPRKAVPQTRNSTALAAISAATINSMSVATANEAMPARLDSNANHPRSVMRRPTCHASIHGAQKPRMIIAALMRIRSLNSLAIARIHTPRAGVYHQTLWEIRLLLPAQCRHGIGLHCRASRDEDGNESNER